jgi:hypothetical protein
MTLLSVVDTRRVTLFAGYIRLVTRSTQLARAEVERRAWLLWLLRPGGASPQRQRHPGWGRGSGVPQSYLAKSGASRDSPRRMNTTDTNIHAFTQLTANANTIHTHRQENCLHNKS